MTAGSAVWVLVDTYDGRIIADEVVPLDSVNEIARAAARSVQDFALQSDRDIDGVRLVWDDEASQHGIRLRTKLRLFGFDAVEAVSEDAAREGRNRTARHIAPHLVLAYGAARAELDDEADKGVLRRLADRVPGRHPGGHDGGTPVIAGRVAAIRTAGSEAAMRISDRARHVFSASPGGMAARVAAAVFAIAVTGVVGYALFGTSPSHEVPETTVAEAVIPEPPAAVMPAPPLPAPQAVAAPVPVPAPAAIQQDVISEAAQTPEYSSPAPTAIADAGVAAVPQVAEVPTTAVAPDVGIVQGVGSTSPELVPTTPTGEPHLTGVGPAAGPAQPVATPIEPSAQATPAAVTPVAPAPGPPPGPLGALFRALP